MIKNERVINDPIILHNISNMKNDFLLWKEESRGRSVQAPVSQSEVF